MTAANLRMSAPPAAGATSSPVYPSRTLSDERNTLYPNDALSFDALNHFGWAGKRDLRDGARILIVGAGNGDATVLLAEQARGTTVKITAIETSETAIVLAKSRLAKRGLTNVEHRQMSLLDLPGAELGEFDIIECSHVLDHLEDPLEGLAALGAVLADDGVMLLSLNAAYGRMSLQVVQALMQHLITDYMPRDLKIEIVREFLRAVPSDHWLGHNSADFIAELNTLDGSGIEALLLQPFAHTFTAADIYQSLDQCGLALVSFAGKDAANYRVETHVKAPVLRDLVAGRAEYEQHVIADTMHGGLRTHQFYASIQDKAPAAFADEMVIVIAPSYGSAAEAAASCSITSAAHTQALLAAMDGKRSVAEIIAVVSSQSGAAAEEVRAQLSALYAELHLHQRVFLRHQELLPNLNWNAIQARLAQHPAILYQ
jgi:2-polyprenyl-3-methyl-5-hydroxy-6-metoxy-1,4-benzoquinol methylase